MSRDSYESYLQVAVDDLEDAVRRCFESAEADRVRVYQAAVQAEPPGQSSGPEMAVPVQQMLEPVGAWTPLFCPCGRRRHGRRHSRSTCSLVAREYGIPAVVGTGNATQLLHTGQLVMVDGSAGTVETHDD